MTTAARSNHPDLSCLRIAALKVLGKLSGLTTLSHQEDLWLQKCTIMNQLHVEKETLISFGTLTKRISSEYQM